MDLIRKRTRLIRIEISRKPNRDESFAGQALAKTPEYRVERIWKCVPTQYRGMPSSQFVHGPVGHHYRGLGIGPGSGVRVGDGDPAEGLPADFGGIAWSAGGLAMRPAIDGNAFHVAIEIKLLAREHAAEMRANLLFLVTELERQHAEARFPILFEARCTDPEDYRQYHDEEWGRPVANDFRLFEKICLE